MHSLRSFAVAVALVAVAGAAHAQGDKKTEDKKDAAADDKKAAPAEAEGDKKDEPAETVAEPAPPPPPPAPVVATPPPPPPKSDGRAAWHPKYAAEIEVHGTVAAFDKFFVGLGGGARASFPIWPFTPFKGFDNDLGFGIGIDIIRYGAYKPRDPKEPTLRVAAYYVPIYIQWNVWMGSRASFFLEPTLMYRFATYIDNCDSSALPCTQTTRFIPTGSLGLRFRLADRVAGTIRVGWPTATLGVSWL